jgi:hypothetical protein
MKKHIFVLLVPLLFLMAQCKKEPLNAPVPTTVKGKVLEADSDIGLPDINVKLIQLSFSDDFLAPPTKTVVQRTKTDAAGNYSFDYINDYINFAYEVEAYGFPTNYAVDPVNRLINRTSSKRGEPQNWVVDLPVRAFGWLKIHVKNVNPFNNRDEVKFAFGTYGGSQVDSTFITKVYGSRTLLQNIRVYVTRNGLETFKDIKMYYPPHDTTKLDIFY